MDTSNVDVVVIGGANVDVKCRTDDPAILHTSNPGRSTAAPGGVARNVAENLARLGVRVALVAAVGRDAYGEGMLQDTHAAGVNVSRVVRTDAPTGTYTAVLDANGELMIAVADMAAMDALTPATLLDRRAVVDRARVVVLDCNLHEPALACALDIARDAGVPVIVDPVSVPKADRLRAVMSPTRPIFTVTPNLDELRALAGGHQGDFAGAIAALHARGVERVWVRLGADGSVLSTNESGAACERIAAHEATVEDVTGAGDAMIAGYVYALLHGAPAGVAARYGHAAAAITVASDRTVAYGMNAERLAAMVDQQERES